MRRDTLETETQRQIEAEIGACPDLLILRNSVGAAKHFDDDGKEWFVPYGLGTGSPDLVGMLRAPCGDRLGGALAVWFCIEVKAAEGTVDPEQEKCIEIWRSFGALIYVCRSAKEARAALEDARRRVRSMLGEAA